MLLVAIEGDYEREAWMLPKLLVSLIENSPEGGGAIERGIVS